MNPVTSQRAQINQEGAGTMMSTSINQTRLRLDHGTTSYTCNCTCNCLVGQGTSNGSTENKKRSSLGQPAPQKILFFYVCQCVNLHILVIELSYSDRSVQSSHHWSGSLDVDGGFWSFEATQITSKPATINRPSELSYTFCCTALKMYKCATMIDLSCRKVWNLHHCLQLFHKT